MEHAPETYRFPAIYFEATRRCNLACKMCMTESNVAETVRRSYRTELTFDEIRNRVLLPAKNLGVMAVGWSGGEFLLRKDAIELLKLTVDLGYICKLCSNGELLTREMLIELRDATDGKITIALGINSIDDNNQLTRDAGVERTLEVLDLCRELDIDRHVIITIGKHNVDSFQRTVDYLVKHRISFNRSPLVARGSGGEHFSDMAFSREDLRDVFHPALREHVNSYVSYTPFFLSPELYNRVSSNGLNGSVPHNPPVGCWVGTWIAINAEGDLSVCPVLLDKIHGGNVRDKPLDRLVLESELFRLVSDRSHLKGRCGRCRYRQTCGGCRAMALYHSGDLMGDDPTCFFEPEDENTVCELEAETNRLFEKYLIIARYVGLYHRAKSN
jgi:radical SAM protein with 4Fe4S-binding SPASM domain